MRGSHAAHGAHGGLDEAVRSAEVSSHSMTFHSSTDITLLFSSWRTETSAQYYAALVAIVLLGLLDAWMTTNVTELLVSLWCPRSDRSSTRPSDGGSSSHCDDDTKSDAGLLTKSGAGAQAQQIPRLWWRLILFISAALQHSLKLILMLLAMTFEVGVFASVIAGLALGHAIFCRDPYAEHRHAH